MMMRCYVEAYGCTMNQAETRMLVRDHLARGYRMVGSPGEADVSIIGTCVVIRKTEERMRRRIAELSSLCESVIVTGCLTHRMKGCGTAMIVAPGDIPMVAGDHFDTVIDAIPISSGCTGNCAYCITKLVRGELRSRPAEDIDNIFRSMVAGGVREIRLACQDTASYGLDLGTGLPGLLRRLLEAPGNHRVRIGMMNPDTGMDILEELVEIMEDRRIYKFLHIPLQSGDDTILESMNRRYTVDDFMNLVSRVRKKHTDLTLSTDVITGFPGETEEQFLNTINIISRIRPDVLNITRFSSRPGTRAAKMKGQVHSRYSKERSRELTLLHREIGRRINNRYTGKKMRALVLERGRDDSFMARTDNYKVVVLREGDQELLGKWVNVRINSANEVYLTGELEV